MLGNWPQVVLAGMSAERKSAEAIQYRAFISACRQLQIRTGNVHLVSQFWVSSRDASISAHK